MHKMDKRTKKVQSKPNPSNAGTEHLVISGVRQFYDFYDDKFDCPLFLFQAIANLNLGRRCSEPGN